MRNFITVIFIVAIVGSLVHTCSEKKECEKRGGEYVKEVMSFGLNHCTK